jgi:hypothetical protein
VPLTPSPTAKRRCWTRLSSFRPMVSIGRTAHLSTGSTQVVHISVTGEMGILPTNVAVAVSNLDLWPGRSDHSPARRVTRHSVVRVRQARFEDPANTPNEPLSASRQPVRMRAPRVPAVRRAVHANRWSSCATSLPFTPPARGVATRRPRIRGPRPVFGAAGAESGASAEALAATASVRLVRPTPLAPLVLSGDGPGGSGPPRAR